MTVEVKLLGPQRAQARKDRIEVPLAPDWQVADLFLYLKSQYPELAFPETAMVVTVNDIVARMDHLLESNDTITFLPLFGGG
jgi:molybdopterin converting factor small subunit